MTLNPQDATRATLGCILSTVWGVAPTHELWNPISLRVHKDFLWSVGNTPFGPFSSSLEMSSVLRAAPSVNQLLALLNHTATDVLGLLNTFSEYGVELEEALSFEDYQQFIRRWNLLEFKLSEALSYLSLGEYDNSFFYLRSAEYDRIALENICSHASKQVFGFFTCEKRGVHNQAQSILPPRRTLSSGWWQALGPLSSFLLMLVLFIRYAKPVVLKFSQKKAKSA